MRRVTYAGLVLLATVLPALAQPIDRDVVEVRRAVEQFLDDLGNRRLDALPARFVPKATMAIVRQRDGQWSSSHQTAEEWLAGGS